MLRLTKAEYLDALEMIVFVEGYMNLEHMLKDEHACSLQYKYMYELINEHFDNPPLKFEELQEDMWVWDNKYKVFNKIGGLTTYFDKRVEVIVFEHLHGTTQKGSLIEFEENRFYRKQVE